MKNLSFATLILFAIAILSSCEEEHVDYDAYIQIRNISQVSFDSVIIKYMSETFNNSNFYITEVDTNTITEFQHFTNIDNQFKVIAWHDSTEFSTIWYNPNDSRLIDPTEPEEHRLLPGYYTFTIISVNDSTNEIDFGLTSYNRWDNQ